MIDIKAEVMHRTLVGHGARLFPFLYIRIGDWDYGCLINDQSRIGDILLNAGHTYNRYLARRANEEAS